MATITGSKRLLSISTDSTAATTTMTLGGVGVATEGYVTTQISNLVASAPGTLDTLNELAAALGDDASFSTTVSTALGNRLRIDTNAQGLNSTQKANGRTNLGLGTASTSATTAFATATQGATADAALPKAGGTITGNLTLDGFGAGYLKTNVDGLISNTATIPWSTVSSTPTTISGYGITDAFDGAYSSLSGTPTIPSGNAIIDWTVSQTENIHADNYTDTTYIVGDGGLTQKNFTTTLNTKLDNIEANATADQTASEILTALLTVDGSGSGLDADKLDGVNSGSFLRSDANDTLSSTLKVTGSVIYENNTSSGYIPFPKGAMYQTTTSGVTGAIKIKLPTHGTSDMMTFVVEIYDYSTNESLTVFIAGYLYQTTNSNEWNNCTVRILANQTGKDYTVRFGADGSNNCVWIGETNTAWSYPQVMVRDFFAAFSADIDAYNDNWAISFVTSFDTVDETRSDNLPAADWDRIESKPTTFAPSAHTHSAADITSGTLADARIASAANWNAAYNNYITGVAITGTGTKTITLTQRDGGTITDTFTDLSGTGGDGNDFLTSVTRSGNVLTFEVSNQTNPTYTFGSAAWTASTDYATAAQGTTADSALQSGDADLTPSWVPATDPSYLTSVAFSDLTTTPTTIAGYGITDALQIGTTATTALAGNTSIPVSGTDFDPVGTDNSTNVTLNTAKAGFLTISGQQITLEEVRLNEIAGGPTAGLLRTDANGNVTVDTNTYSTATGVANNADNYGGWHAGNGADTQLISSGDWVNFNGGVSISGAGTEVNPYLIDLTANYASASHTHTPSEVGLSNLSNNGNSLSGSFTATGDITASGNQVITTGANADVKFSVWSGTTYGIGMTSGVTYGGLNDYAMTFCMNNDSDRGFWWGYSGQTKSAGAMSLTTAGVLTVASTITAGGDITAYSDIRVKENIETIPNALDSVKQMRGVTYNKIGEEKQSVGVVAQELQEVMPQLVSENTDGMLSVAYGNITGVLIEAIKEQQKQIDELKAQLDGITK